MNTKERLRPNFTPEKLRGSAPITLKVGHPMIATAEILRTNATSAAYYAVEGMPKGTAAVLKRTVAGQWVILRDGGLQAGDEHSTSEEALRALAHAIARESL